MMIKRGSTLMLTPYVARLNEGGCCDVLRRWLGAGEGVVTGFCCAVPAALKTSHNETDNTIFFIMTLMLN